MALQYLYRKLRVPAACVVLGGAMAGAVPSMLGMASAHHSTAMFDARVVKEVSGTVTRVNWTNPHTYIFVLVKDDKGAEQEWSIISGTPQLNVRNGWKRDDVKPGDKVAMVIHPDRTGGPAGILRSIKLADGRTLAGPREFLKVPEAN